MPNYNKIIPKHNVFFIDWNLATVCNYSCSYCSPTLHDGKNKFIEIEKILNFITKVKNKYPDKYITIIFTGGEPTVWSKLPDLLFELEKYKIDVQLISNGSKSLDWWDKYVHLIDLILMSYHWEYADKKHFKALCKLIREKNHPNLKVNILVLKDKVDESIALAKEISGEVPGIVVALRPIRFHHGIYMIDYTPEQLELLNQNIRFGGMFRPTSYQNIFNENNVFLNPDKMILSKENDFKGWKCYVGIESIKIREDGFVFRANCDVGGPLGHIKEDFELPNSPIICPNDACKCSADIRPRKERVI